MLLEGKYVIVSGIGPGLGSKLAIHAAIEGAVGVAISARTAAKLDDVEKKIKDTGSKCRIVKHVTDILDSAQCRAFAQTAIDRFGRIDALINNAYYHGPMGDDVQSTDFTHWYKQFETNVVGTLKMTQAVLPQMKAQGNGAIVMISTMGVKMVPPVSEGGYCASKAMLYNSTRKLATEVGPYGIRVNSLHPGWMWGEPVKNDLRENFKEWGTLEEIYVKISSTFALRRIATDDECARAGLFLASDYASAITGASLDANAGGFLP